MTWGSVKFLVIELILLNYHVLLLLLGSFGGSMVLVSISSISWLSMLGVSWLAIDIVMIFSGLALATLDGSCELMILLILCLIMALVMVSVARI